MLSEKEQAFMANWERIRERESRGMWKLLSGLPMACLFCLPIILLVILVYNYLPEWYTKISTTSPDIFITVLVALFICVLFFSYFRMHYKWEMNEQLYRELKARRNRSDAAKQPK
jgi:glucan phosphoethanolaminetransferase (alkaline phosphatase superfamily)